MNVQELVDTARALVAGDKGLLAMDESDKGMSGHPGERITEGLDGLHGRMAEYFRWAPVLRSGAR
jgi:fructose-bisphosphate aldolase class 1